MIKEMEKKSKFIVKVRKVEESEEERAGRKSVQTGKRKQHKIESFIIKGTESNGSEISLF